MANFPSRRLPRGTSTTTATGTSLTDHVAAADPHTQYLLKSDYVAGGTGGSLLSGVTRLAALSGDIRVMLNGSYITGSSQVIDLGTVSVPGHTHNEYIPTSHILTTLEAYNSLGAAAREEYVFSSKYAMDNFLNKTTDLVSNPSTSDTDKAVTGSFAAELDAAVATHLANAYEQNYVGIIPYHKDSSGEELYARRSHIHTYGDIGAAAVNHDHDAVYLKQSDINFGRSKVARGWINGSQIIYTSEESPVIGDSTFINNTLSTSTGHTITAISGSSITVNGLVYIRDNSADYTNYNVIALSEIFAPISHYHNEYLTKYRTVETIIPTTESNSISTSDTVLVRWREGDGTNTSNNRYYAWTADGGATVYYTDTADPGNGTTIYTEITLSTVYDTVVARTSSASLVIDGEGADIQNYALEGTTVATILTTDGTSSFYSGREIKLRITTSGRYTLTYNGVMLLSTEDIGTFVIHMGNYGGGVEVFSIVAVLA